MKQSTAMPSAEEILRQSFKSKGMFGFPPFDKEEMDAIYSAMNLYLSKGLDEAAIRIIDSPEYQGYELDNETIHRIIETIKKENGI